MHKSRRRCALEYALAILIVPPVLYITHNTSLRTGAPFIFLAAPVIFSTWFGGLRPGFITFALTFLGAIYYLSEPEGSLELNDAGELARLAVFAFITILVQLLTVERERAREQARARAAREQALAELGKRALANLELVACFDDATARVCQVLDVSHSLVLELAADGATLLLKAGQGWTPEAVGHTTLPADPTSPVGSTLSTQLPHIVDIPVDARGALPPPLLDHSLRRGVTVCIQGPDRPYGVLGGFTTRLREFSAEEMGFLQSVANLLSLAVQRQRDEDALRQGEIQYRTLVENSPDIICRFDRHLRVSYMNPAPFGLTGIPSADYVGKTATEAGVPTRLAQRIEDKVQAVFDTGKSAHLEFDLTFAAGHRYFDARLVPEVAASGAVDSVLAITRDVTASKEAEQELRRAHELLETMFSSIDLAVAYMDADFNFIRVNRAYAQFNDREPDFFVGKNHFALFPHPENESIFRRVVATGEPYAALAKPFEYAGHPERGVSYWDWSLQPVRETDGRVSGVVLALVNVTERVRAQNAWHETAERLRLVLTHAPVGLWALDHEGRYTLFEGSLAGHCHRAPADVIGTSFWDCTRDQLDLQVIARRAYQGEETCVDLVHAGRVMRSYCWPMRSAPGEIAGVMGMSLDITEERRAERAMQTAMQHTRDLAEQVVRAQEEERRKVSYVLSDDAAQALAAIMLKLQDLRTDLPDASRTQLKAAETAALIASTIGQIQSLADYLHPPALSVLGLNRTLKGYCEQTACNRNIQIDYRGLEIDGVSQAVAITLYRLLQEALRHAQQGHCAHACVSLEQGIDSIELTVEDNGQGFDPQTIWLAPERRGEPGLSDLRERIQLLGGTLETSSTEDEGTCLCARLPLQTPALNS